MTILFYIYSFVVSLLLFREDFEVAFGGLQKNTTIFELTAKSFLIVCNEYCRVNSHAESFHIRLLYSEFHAFR